jgi:hypothetical protein
MVGRPVKHAIKYPLIEHPYHYSSRCSNAYLFVYRTRLYHRDLSGESFHLQDRGEKLVNESHTPR